VFLSRSTLMRREESTTENTGDFCASVYNQWEGALSGASCLSPLRLSRRMELLFWESWDRDGCAAVGDLVVEILAMQLFPSQSPMIGGFFVLATGVQWVHAFADVVQVTTVLII